LLQALASGLPVITCPIGGIPEVARGLDTVTFVPPKDAAALAAAMSAAMRDQPDAPALARARERVVTAHSRDVMYRRALRYFLGT